MLTRQSPLRWTLPHVAHTGRNRPDGALSHTSSRSIHGACRTPSSASSRVRNVWTANRTRTRPMTHTRSLRRSHTSDRPGANRHLSVPCRLSSRRTRGGLRHIQKLFAAGGVEDDDVLGGRAPRPPPPAVGGTLRPAPTRRPEVGSEGAGRIVPRAARPRRRTRPIDRARRIPPCEARREGACKAKERCLTRSTSRAVHLTCGRKYIGWNLRRSRQQPQSSNGCRSPRRCLLSKSSQPSARGQYPVGLDLAAAR
jgi:hypothetical protein